MLYLFLHDVAREHLPLSFVAVVVGGDVGGCGIGMRLWVLGERMGWMVGKRGVGGLEGVGVFWVKVGVKLWMILHGC